MRQLQLATACRMINLTAESEYGNGDISSR